MIRITVCSLDSLAIVSTQPEMDQAIADLVSVAEFGTSAAPGTGVPDVSRHYTMEAALEWCRNWSGGLTVRFDRIDCVSVPDVEITHSCRLARA